VGLSATILDLVVEGPTCVLRIHYDANRVGEFKLVDLRDESARSNGSLTSP
jgi:hypothetical protein